MLRAKTRWILCLSLMLLFLASAVLPIFANELDEKKQEQAEIEKQLEAERNSLKQQRNRETTLEQELEQLNRRLKVLQLEKERLAAEILGIEEEITETEAELAEAEEQLAIQDGLLKRRLRAMYEQGSVTYLEVLLNASSFSDFLTRLNNLKMIASNDLRLVDEIQAERDRIQAIKDDLELKKEQLEAMRRQTLANEAEMEHAAETREQILVELQAEIAKKLKEIQDLEKEYANIARIIREMGGGAPGSGLVGKLHWPMEWPYVITSPFGWRKNPFNRAQTTWHGAVDIAPYYGAPNYIFAAESGEVILSSWNGGYGNCIMINHGNGLVTAYGHMSSLLVKKGDWVSKGQRIARAGTTGNSTGVHLHFEVWDYNKPPFRSGYPNDRRHDPMGYL